MKTHIVLLTVLALSGIAQSQAKPSGTQGQFARTLKQMEQKAGTDPKALVEAAAFAKNHGFVKDQERILNRVLKLDPENEPAHKALGFAKYKGKWMKKDEALALEKADTEAE